MTIEKRLGQVKQDFIQVRRRLGAARVQARDRIVYPIVTRNQRGVVVNHERFAQRDGSFGLEYFLNRLPETPMTVAPAPKRIFVLWTGDNDLTPNRRASLEALRATQSPDVEVVLVTPKNLHEWEVPESPIPPPTVISRMSTGRTTCAVT